MIKWQFLIIALGFSISSDWCQQIDKGIPHQNGSFDKRIENCNVVLTSEVHFTASSPVTKYQFITYLNKYHGFTEYLMETGYAEGYLFTKYLETGDTTYIMFNSLYRSEDYKVMWDALYQYNQLLPGENKINVIGIDYERQRPAIHAIESLLNDLNIEDAFNGQMQALNKLKQNPDVMDLEDETLRIFNELSDELHTETFSYLREEENYKHLLRIVSNHASHLRMTDRNKDFVKNFYRIYNPDRRYYGQFGGVHLRWEKNYTFVNQLIQEIPDLNIDNVEAIPTRYYNAYITSSSGRRQITGGGYSFTINNKKSVLESELGDQLANGIYLLDVNNMPKKLSRKVPDVYRFMLYIKGSKELRW